MYAAFAPLPGETADGPWNDFTEFASTALDGFLAHPDELLVLLVERGAIERAGWTKNGNAVWQENPEPDDYPVYRRVRPEETKT